MISRNPSYDQDETWARGRRMSYLPRRGRRRVSRARAPPVLPSAGCMPLLAEVAVPVPLSHAFSYEVPDALADGVRPGARVVCQFGPRRLLGVVLAVADREPPPGIKRLKPI